MFRRYAFPIDTSGSVAIMAAGAICASLALIAFTIDFAISFNQKSRLQDAVDAAALAAAKELTLIDTTSDNLESIVRAIVRRRIDVDDVSQRWDKPVEIKVRTPNGKREVHVTAKQDVASAFGLHFSRTKAVFAQAVARVIGNPNICVLALEPKEVGALWLEKASQLVGRDCAVFSNSTSSYGLTVRDSAHLEASAVCSAGGVEGKTNIAPAPLTDCPQFDDPLGSRPEPAVNGCDYNNLQIKSETRTLWPGVYCGGLKIDGTSRISLEPGDFVIKDGIFSVSGTSELKGEHVSFLLMGSSLGSWLYFGPDTTISLTASRDGPLAGLLFFASRTQSKLVTHTILSKNAHVLLGTIYMPNNSFIVDGSAQIGQESAYTAIVARRVVLLSGPRLVLNTNYHLSDVPVPDGIKGVAQPARLVR